MKVICHILSLLMLLFPVTGRCVTASENYVRIIIIQTNRYLSGGLPQTGMSVTDKTTDNHLYCGMQYMGTHSMGFYDNEARIYDALLTRFTTPDPLSEKYPDISPYASRANNPLLFVDEDGRDYDVTFDENNNIVTIKAKYYTFKEDEESLNSAISYWNNNSNKFSIDGYKVEFRLDVKIIEDMPKSGNLKTDLTILNTEISKDMYSDFENKKTNLNAYIVTDKETRGSGGARGNLIMVDRSQEHGTTGSHEVGHTLGLEHKSSGIMTPTNNDIARQYSINKSYIKDIISNAFSPKNNGVGKGTVKSDNGYFPNYNINKL